MEDLSPRDFLGSPANRLHLLTLTIPFLRVYCASNVHEATPSFDTECLFSSKNSSLRSANSPDGLRDPTPQPEFSPIFIHLSILEPSNSFAMSRSISLEPATSIKVSNTVQRHVETTQFQDVSDPPSDCSLFWCFQGIQAYVPSPGHKLISHRSPPMVAYWLIASPAPGTTGSFHPHLRIRLAFSSYFSQLCALQHPYRPKHHPARMGHLQSHH